MRVYDQIAAVVKSGGKTRRAAKMQSLKVWHPDILEFIECKAKEEKKARMLIEKGGYDANFNGEAYSSILFQNANLSVRVTDDFMQAVERRQALDHALGHRSQRRRPDVTRPATCCARWPKAPGTAAIRACSTTRRSTAGTPARTRAGSTPRTRAREYMFLDDTACNLASINLMKFRQDDGTFDVERFRAACRIFFIAQEILVDHASYPTQADRREQPSLPPAGPGLLEPRQPDHVERPGLRLATRPAACAVR